MRTTTIKILTALCIALLPSMISARTYRLVQCHIVEYGTDKEYDLQRAQFGAELSYDVEYDIRARIYRGKAPNDYYSNGYYGKKQIELKRYSKAYGEIDGRAIKIYLNNLGYVYAQSDYDRHKSYLIYEAVY